MINDKQLSLISENFINDNYKYHVIDKKYNFIMHTNRWLDVINSSNGIYVVFSRNRNVPMHLRSKIGIIKEQTN